MSQTRRAADAPLRQPVSPALLARLFLVTFRIGAFTFGGGYAMIPLMQREFVDNHGWIEKEEIASFFAVAQSLPGVIAVNASIMIGTRIAGFAGAVAALLGVTLPSLITLVLVSLAYKAFIANPLVQAFMRGVRACVVALMATAVPTLAVPTLTSRFAWALAAGALLVTLLAPQVHAAFVLLGAGCLGLFAHLLARAKEAS